MSINTVYGCLNKFFLKMRKALDIILGTLNFDLGFTRDNTETCARGIEKATIEFLEDIGKFATVIVNNYCIIYS